MPREKKQKIKKRPDGRYACRYKDQWFYSTISSDDALEQRRIYMKMLEEEQKAATTDHVTVDELLGRPEPQERQEQEDEDVMAFLEQLRRDPDTRILFQAALKATPEHIQAAAEMLESLKAEELPDAN